MKKLLTIALTSLLAASLLAPSGAGAAVAAAQEVEGSILLPAVFAQGTFDGCWAGATRRITQTAAGQGNGVVGYRFPIEKSTWNGKFKLEVTGGEGDVDLDIFLYTTMPPAEAVLDDPVNGGTPVSVDYTTREPGGETGTIVKGATDAIVCMYGGPTHVGFNSTFKYTGTPPVKKKR
ncbi:MAG: hypothetical protein ACLGIB_10585 [Actinomycetota bacterium]